MIFSPRVSLRELADLCRRMATGIEAGIELRRLWSREAGTRLSPRLRRELTRVSEEIAAGNGVSDALASTEEFFPLLFREMVEVGEESGRLSEVFRQLTDHYEYRLKMRRDFLAAITWPAVQLGIAILVIGGMIWIMGFIGSMNPQSEPIDVLGLGLVGTEGLVIYLLVIGAIAAALFFLIQAVRRGVFWTQPLQRAVMRIPALGPCLRTMALSRMAWTLFVTMETGMDLRKAMALSLRSTRNARFTADADTVVREIAGGTEISVALAETGAYPRDFLDTLEVGEQSGRVPESMAVLSRQYQEQANRAMAVIMQLAGFAVWAMVAAIIIVLIFRIAFFYINTLNNAARGVF